MQAGSGPGGEASLDTVEQAEAALAEAEVRIGGMTGAGDAAGAMTHAPSAEPGTTQLDVSPKAAEPAPPEPRCETACGALGSMRRAADRVCELAPGDRCESAHARVVTAEKRVSDSCPGCSA
jgi:hypothetical protein